jgi:hypothetical protein
MVAPVEMETPAVWAMVVMALAAVAELVLVDQE